MQNHVFSHRLRHASPMEIADQRLDDRQQLLSHGIPTVHELAAHQSRRLQSFVNIEVKQANLGLRHARERVRLHPGELQQRSLREARVESDLRSCEHLEVLLVDRLVARTRGVSQAAGHSGIQPDELDRLGKRIRPPDAIGEQKFDDRGQERFLLFGPGDRFQSDLLAFEKLDEADTLDVFGGESLVALGTDELERFAPEDIERIRLDRKSTRLNSSHTVISYAVFCLKKKIKYK